MEPLTFRAGPIPTKNLDAEGEIARPATPLSEDIDILESEATVYCSSASEASASPAPARRLNTQIGITTLREFLGPSQIRAQLQ